MPYAYIVFSFSLRNIVKDELVCSQLESRPLLVLYFHYPDGSIPMWSLGGTSLETVLQRSNQKFMEHCRHETGDEIPCFVVTMNHFKSPLIIIKHYCFHMCSISWRFEALNDKQGGLPNIPQLKKMRCVCANKNRLRAINSENWLKKC